MFRKKQFLLLLVLCFAASQAYTQTVKVIDNKGTIREVESSPWTSSGVAIYNKNTGNVVISNGTAPSTINTNAALQFTETTKGILIPRVELLATNAVSPFTALSASDNGLMVYNTATAGTTPNNVIPGFYYWETNSWKAIAATSAITIAALNTTSTANGGTLINGELKLSPADATNGGVVTNTAQNIAGEKNFISSSTIFGSTSGSGLELGQNLTQDGGANIDFHSTSGSDYNTRFSRESGVDGDFSILHNGTGAFRIGYFEPIFVTLRTYFHLKNGFLGLNTDNPNNYNLAIASTGPYNRSYNLGFNDNGANVVSTGNLSQTYAAGSYYSWVSGIDTKMILTANDNLLLGTSSDAGYKLDVSGNARFKGPITLEEDSGFNTITYPNTGGSAGQVLTTDGLSPVANATWQNPAVPTSFSGNLAGDVTGTQAATVVQKINGVALSGLSTGLLKNTTGTGVPSIAVAGTDYVIPSGSITGNAATATTATTATNSAITDDSGINATVYPTWVTANTGNLPIKVSSTKFTFNPLTGKITATGDATISGLTVGKGGNQTSSFNTALGSNALSTVTAGNSNTAIGYETLKKSTGSSNTALGTYALQNSVAGDNNTALGYNALLGASGARDNTAIGTDAGNSISSGNYNTLIGSQTSIGSAKSNSTAIGYQASVILDNTIQLGNTNVINVNTSGALTTGAVTYPIVHGSSGQFLKTDGSVLSWATPSTVATAYSGILPIPNGGTGSATQNFVDLTTNQSIAGTKTFNNAVTNFGSATGGTGLELGTNITQDSHSFIDFHSALPTSTDFDARIIRNLGTNSNLDIFNAGSGGIRLVNNSTTTLFAQAGNVGIGNVAPAYKLDVTGTGRFTGALTTGAVTYPIVAGTNGQVLTTDGTSLATWQNPSVPTSFSGNLVGDVTGTQAATVIGVDKVTSAKILDGTIATADIADNTITTAKITDANVTNNKLANSTFTINGTSVSLGSSVNISASPVGTSLTSGYILVGSASNQAIAVPISGDISLSNTGLLTLDNTTVSPGNYGTATQVPQITVNSKGLLTGATNVNLAEASSTTTGILSNADWNTFNDKQATFTSQTANTFYAAPNGSAGTPSFRAILASDIPTLNQNTTGTATTATNATITNDLTPTTAVYPTWVTANTGNLPIKVSDSKFSFIPSTGSITATGDATINGLTIGKGKNSFWNNTAIGAAVLANNTSGTENTGLGIQVLPANTLGNQNTSVGAYSLFKNTEGNYNTATGFASLSNVLTQSNNTAIGYKSLTALGTGIATANGIGNTAIGYLSGFDVIKSINNTFLGNSTSLSASVLSSGISNATAIGYNAKVSASNTIQLGADGTIGGTTPISNVKTSGTLTAGTVTYPNTGGTNGQVLTTNGSVATWANTGAGSVTNVSTTLTNTNTGTDITFATTNSTSTPAITLNVPDASATARGVVTTAAQTFAGTKTFSVDAIVNGLTVGKGSGTATTTNTAVGTSALLLNSLGVDNTALGYSALKTNSSGSGNTAIGKDALFSNSTGSENTAIGLAALTNTTSGANTAIGHIALLNNTTGVGNVAVGASSLSANTLANYNTAIGKSSLNNNSTSSDNTAVGSATLGALLTGSGLNTAVGKDAGNLITTGYYNTFLGTYTNVSTATGYTGFFNATAIGYDAKVNASNTMQFGNGSVTDVLFGSATITGNTSNTPAVGGSGANVRARGFYTNSDRRIKKDIVNTQYGLNSILKLRPVDYHLINDISQAPQVGFIAQEVKEVVPELVSGKEGDLAKGEILGVNYGGLAPILTKAIQEQQVQIIGNEDKTAALTIEVADLKTQLKNQQTQIDELKALLEKVLAAQK